MPPHEPNTHDVVLTRVSLLSLLLMTIHVADDIQRGLSPADASNVIGVAIFVVWLFGTLAVPDRSSGQVIMLLGGLFGALMPVLHMTGSGYAAVARGSGGLLFVWTLLALGTLSTVTTILAARGLWRSR